MPLFSNLTITAFTKKVDFEIEKLFNTSHQWANENLTKSQKLAMNYLAKNESIIIKPADNVVMDKSKYTEEALRQINNKNDYK